jgi:hypothetical protein
MCLLVSVVIVPSTSLQARQHVCALFRVVGTVSLSLESMMGVSAMKEL